MSYVLTINDFYTRVGAELSVAGLTGVSGLLSPSIDGKDVVSQAITVNRKSVLHGILQESDWSFIKKTGYLEDLVGVDFDTDTSLHAYVLPNDFNKLYSFDNEENANIGWEVTSMIPKSTVENPNPDAVRVITINVDDLQFLNRDDMDRIKIIYQAWDGSDDIFSVMTPNFFNYYVLRVAIILLPTFELNSQSPGALSLSQKLGLAKRIALSNSIRNSNTQQRLSIEGVSSRLAGW